MSDLPLTNGSLNKEPFLSPEELEAVRLIRANRPANLNAASVQRIQKLSLARLGQQQRMIQKQANQKRVAMVFWQWALAVAVVAVLVVASTGLAAASTTSLPGAALYPVKRIGENIQLALTPKAQLPAFYEKLAETRLGEVEALAVHGRVPANVLQDLTDSTEKSLANVNTLSDDQQLVLLTKVAILNLRAQIVLENLAKQSPVQDQTLIGNAQQAAETAQEQAQIAIQTIANGDPNPGAVLIVASATASATATLPAPSPTIQSTVNDDPDDAEAPGGRQPHDDEDTTASPARTPVVQPTHQTPATATPVPHTPANGPKPTKPPKPTHKPPEPTHVPKPTHKPPEPPKPHEPPQPGPDHHDEGPGHHGGGHH